jgi:triacylglycerol lipase
VAGSGVVSESVLAIIAIVVLVALFVAAVTVTVLVVVRRRWRRRRGDRGSRSGIRPRRGKHGPGPPLPVVLAHGLFGFDRIGVPGAKLHYFNGIVRHLETLGCDAHAVRVPAMGSVPARAAALVKAVESLPHDRVDIIAHSLGGLDARYALARLGLARRVRALVTIGTPHRGTPLADLAVGGPLDWARRMVRTVGLPIDALEWLSSEALERFNREVPDVRGVRYACVVGGMRHKETPVALALIPAHAYLRRCAGANDGLVPIASQYWGETLAEIEADHFAQIGWRITAGHSFDALGLYSLILDRLGDAAPVTRAARAS